MKQFILWNIVLSIIVGFLGPWCSLRATEKLIYLWSTIGTAFQEPPPEPRPSQKSDFVDEKLQAFARTYVAIRRLIAEHEPPLRQARNPEQARKIQREAALKMEQTLDVHGFTPDSFQRTFALVNADDGLRSKALELIDREQGKLSS